MIRKAKQTDFDDMDAIFRSSAKRMCSASYSSEKVDDWSGEPWPERFLKSENDGNDQYVFIRENNVVCFGAINIDKSLLVSLFVDPYYSGKNIGQEMLNFLVKQAENANLKVLQLDSSLNAVNFYSRNGFTETGRGKFSTHNGTVLDSVQMERVLYK